MSELRDWYLNALGVVRYVPRAGNGAEIEAPYKDEDQSWGSSEPASSFESSVESIAGATPASPAAVKAAVDATAALRESLQSGSGDSGAATSPRTVNTTEISQGSTRANAEPSPATAALENEDAKPFRLAFWQPSSALVVLSALPPGARPSQAQQDMLANLLKAIGELGEALPAVEWIDWPLAKQPSISASSAREFVETFLDVKHKLQHFSTVLLMGCGHLTLDHSKGIGKSQTLRCSATGIVTHSLDAMERDPGLKRQTWEAIRHLAEK